YLMHSRTSASSRVLKQCRTSPLSSLPSSSHVRRRFLSRSTTTRTSSFPHARFRSSLVPSSTALRVLLLALSTSSHFLLGSCKKRKGKVRTGFDRAWAGLEHTLAEEGSNSLRNTSACPGFHCTGYHSTSRQAAYQCASWSFPPSSSNIPSLSFACTKRPPSSTFPCGVTVRLLLTVDVPFKLPLSHRATCRFPYVSLSFASSRYPPRPDHTCAIHPPSLRHFIPPRHFPPDVRRLSPEVLRFYPYRSR
ncbi:hypothetical protein BD310DRAFT_919679, partial [Dichomitus squalens]